MLKAYALADGDSGDGFSGEAVRTLLTEDRSHSSPGVEANSVLAKGGEQSLQSLGGVGGLRGQDVHQPR